MGPTGSQTSYWEHWKQSWSLNGDQQTTSQIVVNLVGLFFRLFFIVAVLPGIVFEGLKYYRWTKLNANDGNPAKINTIGIQIINAPNIYEGAKLPVIIEGKNQTVTLKAAESVERWIKRDPSKTYKKGDYFYEGGRIYAWKSTIIIDGMTKDRFIVYPCSVDTVFENIPKEQYDDLVMKGIGYVSGKSEDSTIYQAGAKVSTVRYGKKTLAQEKGELRHTPKIEHRAFEQGGWLMNENTFLVFDRKDGNEVVFRQYGFEDNSQVGK